MRCLRTIIAMATLGSSLAACAESTGPLPGADAMSTVPAGVAAAARTPRTSTKEAAPAVSLTPLKFATWAPPLETYDTTFKVTQGKASSDTLFFQKDAFGVRMPYLVIDVPKDAQFVDAAGKPVPKGATVNLTVQADRQYVQVNFGPHGSTFSKNPATVKVSWFYTDLMGRWGGDLKLWYQPEVNTAWNQLATQVDLQFYWLVSTLDHFSNYAVAY
jgi:hypothetical protein